MPHRTRSKSRPQSSSSSSGIIIEVTGRSDDVSQTEMKAERDEPLDKENVKNSAFQPPSPLTSRRNKQKPSTAKKILSPNQNSQWSRSRESTSSSIHPRSSPIHTSHPYSKVRNKSQSWRHDFGAPFFHGCGRDAHLSTSLYRQRCPETVMSVFWSQIELDSRPACNPLKKSRCPSQLDCNPSS
jgi:hypothetical protein